MTMTDTNPAGVSRPFVGAGEFWGTACLTQTQALPLGKLGEQFTFGDQLIEPAALDDVPLAQDQDRVDLAHSR